ncbi:MAG TPA: aminotransferase class IV, partial [Bacteroidia bacterium]|nr:aminotransferase class IV [Bacteroidia bacterium]
GLRCPEDAALLSAADEILAANGLRDADLARVRITLSSPADGSESWWVEATPPPPHPPEAAVVTGPFVRNERSPLAGLKTVNYGENIVALRAAREAGADEALFQNTRGELCEGTWSNVFVRVADRWLTPPLDSGCLPGITRQLVIALFRELGIGIEESTLLIDEVNRVESGFLTSSLREIQPISTLDGRTLLAAPEIRALQASYRQTRSGTFPSPAQS